MLITSTLQKGSLYCIRMSDILTEKQQYILGNTGNIDYASEYNAINIELNLCIIPNNNNG